MEFIQANVSDIEKITKLYNKAIGSMGCTWSEEYPSEEHTSGDLERGDLFCLKNDDGDIIGAISIDADEAVDNLRCWSGNGAELSRLVVKDEYQNQGIAGIMIKSAMRVLKGRGYEYVHFLVSKEHKKALRAYAKLGFDNVGESDLYDGNWWCYEKKL